MELVSVLWIPVAYLVGALCGFFAKTHDINVMGQMAYSAVVEMILNEYVIHQPRHAERLVMELNEYMSRSKREDQLSAELRSFIKKVEYINGNSKQAKR